MPSSYPLDWPSGWPRTASPRRASFDRYRTLAQARDALLHQLKLLGAGQEVVSTNVVWSDRAQPLDKGVAIYFELRGRSQVLACDRWDRVADNLYAVAKHVEAIRGQNRWGVGTVDQAFAGYALPPKPAWYDVLQVSAIATAEEIRRAFEARAHAAHPDRGGTGDLAALKVARDEGLRARGVAPIGGGR